MSTLHTVQTILEILICAAFIGGLIGEDKIVKYEKRLFRTIKKLWEVIR